MKSLHYFTLSKEVLSDTYSTKAFQGCKKVLFYSPYKEAEEAEECVHEAHIVGDAGDDGLLTVRTHSLHRVGLEHLPLQDGHSGGSSRRSQDGGCVPPHVDKVTGTRAHGSRHRKVTGRVVATCTGGSST